MSSSGLTLPPNVIRQPRGPEDGKGFQRTRKISATAAEEEAAASAIANLCIVPVIVTHDASSSDDEDDSDDNVEKSR